MTTEHAQATPRPWEYEVEYDGETSVWPPIIGAHLDGGYEAIAAFDLVHLLNYGPDRDTTFANAELIVRAVNAHDDMLAALEAVLLWIDESGPTCRLCNIDGSLPGTPCDAADCPMHMVRAALRKARE